MNIKFFIANWKMELTHQESLNLLGQAKDDLIDLKKMLQKKNYQLIICPSFDVISPASSQLKVYAPEIVIGAQDCSQHDRGPYTGQVAAISLSEIGSSYCIIGHSERRAYQGETNEEVFGKAKQLIKNKITPIICIGETKEEKEAGKTREVLEKQINICEKIYSKLCPCLSEEQMGKVTQLCIAYEPVWAIGTGLTPDENELAHVLEWTRKKLGPLVPLLYGGSVQGGTIQKIAATPEIDGFLIGRASTDIQKLKKMVQLV